MNQSFTYDTHTRRNLLESAAVVGGTTSYAYDADDWRVKKASSGTTTYFLAGSTGRC